MMNRADRATSFKHVHVRFQAGLSLIDLMVGLAVGLIVTLVVISALGTMAVQRRTAVSSDSAKESGQAALSIIEREAKFAGAGLFYNGGLICTSINIYRGEVLADGAALAPVLIADGGDSGSDEITFTYASAQGGSTIAHLVNDMPTNSANMIVNNAANLAVGDLTLVGVPGSTRPCTLFQITGFSGTLTGNGNCNGITTNCIRVLHNSGQSDFNPPNYTNTFADAPRYGHATAGTVIGPAVMTRIGTLSHRVYRVLCNSLVMHDALDGPTCTSSPLTFTDASPLASNIVQLKAQYGVTDSASSDIVTQWVDATGAWAAPGAVDIPRIKALRIVVVSRAPEVGAGNITSACTNAAGVANVGPCSFQDADAPVIDLSAVPVPAGTNWRNFRYRVFHSVIPLRTVLWNY